jgi:hypothetical protein
LFSFAALFRPLQIGRKERLGGLQRKIRDFEK